MNKLTGVRADKKYSHQKLEGLSDHKPYEDTEWQANAFASSLLMPARGLAALEERYGQLSAVMISDKFKVSYETAGYRLTLFNQRRGELLLV